MSARPSREQVCAAATAAALLTGEAPDFILSDAIEAEARVIAYAALLEAFPKAEPFDLAVYLAFPRPTRAQTHLARRRRSVGWNEHFVDEVVGALVADRYGARGQ